MAERPLPPPPEDPAALPGWLEAGEAEDVRPGCGHWLRWGPSGPGRAPVALLYLHGFSATPRELSPVPEGVADALGAHLVALRLTGHGRGGPAMAEATLEDWRRDTARGLAAARVLGERVIVMGCSTGATLAALALAEGAEVAGAVLVAPNFRIGGLMAQLVLDLPGATAWAPWIIGRERSFEVISPTHEALWTTRYPTRAVGPVGAAVRAFRAADPGRIAVPALFAFAETDAVVDARATHRVMARWGGPVTHLPMVMGPGDDARGHLVAGDVFSPGQTAGLVSAVARWARPLVTRAAPA